jgi:hypothetical protein
VYAISPTDEISIVRRLPHNADRLEFEGWVFLSASGWWDSSDLERLSQAAGLYAISPSYGELASQAWWKAFARSYLNHRDALAAIIDIGEPTDERWDRDPASLGITTPCGGDAGAEDGSVLERIAPSSRSKWIGAKRAVWKVRVPAEHLLPKMHVEFILRQGGRERVSTRFHEMILARLGSKLAIRSQRGIIAIPGWGSWPSPIAVNCDLFIKTARAAVSTLLTLAFENGSLRIDGVRITAREL